MSVKQPTPIQSLVLPYLFETSLDLNVSARHGTGKTLIYLIAILDYICRVKQEIKYRPGSPVRNQPLAVIILPNSFLVKEVVSRIKALDFNISNGSNFHCYFLVQISESGTISRVQENAKAVRSVMSMLGRLAR